MRNILAFFLLLLLPIAASAEITFSGKVVQILNYEGHDGPLITVDNMAPTNGVCPRNDYYILPLAHQYFKQNYQLLLAAKLANKTIWIYVDSPGNCVQQLNRIKHLSITD